MRRAAPCLFLLACACKKTEEPLPGNVQQITAPADLIQGPEASGRIGDWRLDNGLVQFVVQDAGSSTGWGTFGGSLVDIGPDDTFGELFIHCDLRGFRPERAEVIGADTLRITGHDRGIPFLDAVLPTQSLDVELSMDFILPKDTSTLELVVRASDERKKETRDLGCGAVVVDQLQGLVHAEHGWIGQGVPAGGRSWVLSPKSGDWTVLAPQADVAVLTAPSINLRGGGKTETRYLLSVGSDETLESALVERRRVLGEDALMRTPVTLDVDASAMMLPYLDSMVLQLGATSTKRGGQVALAPGHYTAQAIFDDRVAGELAFDVPGTTNAVVPVHSLGILGVRVTDGGQVTPARVRLLHGNQELLDDYIDGDAELVVPAGEHELIVSLGPEYELAESRVTVASDQKMLTTTQEMQRAFDTTGWLSGDFHIHSTRSVDSQVTREMRVLGAVAEGLDVMVTTDHDTVSDFSPVAEALGLSSRIRTVSGIEVSPLYGHMNGFPVTPQKPEAYFKPSWVKYDEGGVFERMLEPLEITHALREMSAEIVQLNHPRGGTGVFDYLEFDPATAETRRAWPECDAIEVLNGQRIDEFDTVLADFVSLLLHKKRVIGTGTSDAHGVHGVGFPRTMIKSDGSDLWGALKSGRAIATTGPFATITATAAGGLSAEIGDTITTRDPVTIAMRVMAPSWMSVETVTLLQNGVPVLVRAASSDSGAVRFLGTYTSTTPGDLFFMLRVDGGENPPPGKLTRALTNPIFVDRR